MSKEFKMDPEEVTEVFVPAAVDREKEFSIQFEDPDFDFLFAEEEKAG